MSHWDKATHFRSKSPPKRSVTNLDWKSQKYLVLDKCKSLENWSQFLIFSSKFDVKQYKLFSLFEMSRDIRFWYFRVTNWQTREQTIEMDHGSGMHAINDGQQNLDFKSKVWNIIGIADYSVVCTGRHFTIHMFLNLNELVSTWPQD